MGRDKDLEEKNNKEYADGYGSGRSGDLVRDIFVDVVEDKGQWKTGYDAGRHDRHENGYKSKDDCGTGETREEPSSGCFLATACVSAMGLPDNCLELRTLRSFRDKILLPSSAGRKAIKEYYRIAPSIVKAVNVSGKSEEVWSNVYLDVQKAVSLVKRGMFNEAFEHYKQMTTALKTEYL